MSNNDDYPTHDRSGSGEFFFWLAVIIVVCVGIGAIGAADHTPGNTYGQEVVPPTG